MSELAQAIGARLLLCLPVFRVRYEHRPRPAAHDIEHRVVSCLRDRDERVTEQRRKIRACPFDHGSRIGLALQTLQRFARDVGAGQHSPRKMAEA